jgi:hypothetical protein
MTMLGCIVNPFGSTPEIPIVIAALLLFRGWLAVDAVRTAGLERVRTDPCVVAL